MSTVIQSHEDRPVIIGGGVAGLLIALHLAPAPVLLLSRAPLGTEASSAWAQGGLAAAMGDDDDPVLHLADTLAAGDGLCDRAMASRILHAAPGAIEGLAAFGVRFDRSPQGRLRLGLEAAHSRRRIIHADGDGSGREIMRALVAAVRSTPSITVVEGMEARRLAVADNAIQGVWADGPAGRAFFGAHRVVLATGGIGGLFFETTNPTGNCGQGLALAAHAGATLADLEFIQFHPTALDGSGSPMALISEAVRGEGALLVDETGRRFLAGIQGAELAPRDVVARAVWNHLASGHRVFLDARERLGPAFARHFPTIAAACGKLGIDPGRHLIPIRPAQHYHMGGIAVDGSGRSSVSGLWACGEVASTGLHGANRLASNSLTEAVVCSRWVAEDLAGIPARPVRLVPADDVPSPDPAPVRALFSPALGVVRDEAGLTASTRALLPLVERKGPTTDPAAVALMIAIAALRRRESRGAHHRADYPHHAPIARRSAITLGTALATARDLTAAPALESLSS
jgi:L-aspartate oxidase